MLVHYIEFFYPGIIVTETSSQKIESRSELPDIPERAFGYQFYDVEEVRRGKELLKGNPKNHSGKYYFGVEMTLAEVREKMPREKTLIGNMERNNYPRIVHTQYEQSMPLNENDVVIGEH